MKYSTVIVAAFAAGAMARAIPDESAEIITTTPTEVDYTQTEEYRKTHDKNYKPKDDNYKPKDDSYKPKDDSYKPKDDSYKPKDDSYKKEVHYAPKPDENPYTSYKTYEQNKESKHYAPTPYEDKPEEYKKYEEKSCFDDLKWKKNVYADDDCEVQYKPKDKSYNKPVKVYVYGSDDYSKPIEECGEDKENTGKIHWKPKKDWIPSDCKDKGRMYRFKICKADNEEDYTWSEEFPVYNPYYYASKPEAKPEPSKCPPATVPVYPVEVPVKEETPAAPAAPEAPATEAPAAPAAPEAPAAESPAYPTAEAPATLAANTTDEAVAPFTSGSSAVKTSISFMVGIAALVTFAL